MEINFGNAKPLAPCTDFEEGVYTLVIEKWECKEPKRDESKGKGVNIALTFSIADLQGAPPVWYNLWMDFANPFAAKAFFEALLERELGEGDSIPDIEDPDYWIGEKVRCALVHESYDYNGKSGVKWAPVDWNAWLPAA